MLPLEKRISIDFPMSDETHEGKKNAASVEAA